MNTPDPVNAMHFDESPKLYDVVDNPTEYDRWSGFGGQNKYDTPTSADRRMFDPFHVVTPPAVDKLDDIPTELIISFGKKDASAVNVIHAADMLPPATAPIYKPTTTIVMKDTPRPVVKKTAPSPKVYDSRSARLSYGRTRRFLSNSDFSISGEPNNVMRSTNSDGTDKVFVPVTPPVDKKSKPLSDRDAQLFQAIEEEMLEQFPPTTDEKRLGLRAPRPKRKHSGK